MPLSKDQKKHLSSCRKLLSSKDWSFVQQGLQLLISLQDPDILSIFEEDLRITAKDVLVIDAGEITKRVKSAYRENVALAIAKNAGWFTYRNAIALSTQRRVIDLSGLGTLPQLKHCKLNAWSIRDIHQIGTLTQLETLDLSGCKSISDISPLANLTNLKALDLSGCHAIQSLLPLQNLMNLTRLGLRGVNMCSDISQLHTLRGLKYLDLSYIKNLKDLQPLSNLASLRELDLKFCKSVRDLSPLQQAKSLTWLNLKDGNQRLSSRETCALKNALPKLTIVRDWKSINIIER